MYWDGTAYFRVPQMPLLQVSEVSHKASAKYPFEPTKWHVHVVPDTPQLPVKLVPTIHL